MDVKVVGDATYGKPVGQYGFDFVRRCSTRWRSSSRTRGRGRLLQRDPGDCAAADDVDHALADPRRPRSRRPVRDAKRSLQRNRGSPGEGAGRFRETVPPIRVDGWRQTINAW